MDRRIVTSLGFVALLSSSSLAASYLVGTATSMRETMLCKLMPCLFQGFVHSTQGSAKKPIRIHRYMLGRGQEMLIVRDKTEKILRVDYLRGTGSVSDIRSAKTAAMIANAASGIEISPEKVTSCWQRVGKPHSLSLNAMASKGFNNANVACFFDGQVHGLRVSSE